MDGASRLDAVGRWVGDRIDWLLDEEDDHEHDEDIVSVSLKTEAPIDPHGAPQWSPDTMVAGIVAEIVAGTVVGKESRRPGPFGGRRPDRRPPVTASQQP